MTVAEWAGFRRPLRNLEQPQPTNAYAILCKDLILNQFYIADSEKAFRTTFKIRHLFRCYLALTLNQIPRVSGRTVRPVPAFLVDVQRLGEAMTGIMVGMYQF